MELLNSIGVVILGSVWLLIWVACAGRALFRSYFDERQRFLVKQLKIAGEHKPDLRTYKSGVQ